MAQNTSAVIEAGDPTEAETVKIPGAREAEEPSMDDSSEIDEIDDVDDEIDEIDEIEQQADASGPVEAMDVALDLCEQGPSLDEDPDTSMAESLQLHLISEHAVAGALQFDDEEAERQHRRLHAIWRHPHPIADRRFRPGRAISVMMLQVQREHEQNFPTLQPATP
jgi:hypothetical protein